MANVSEKYTRVQFLYNINSLKNLKSIFESGLLSKNQLKDSFARQSVDLSNPDVQNRRDHKEVANHGELHDYANLYFDARNPMMYYITCHQDIEDLCVICFHKKVLDLEGTIVTDRNAATELALFETPEQGLNNIDFDLVFAPVWNDPDYIKKANKKAIKCAEVLVWNKIPAEFVVKVKVATAEARRKAQNLWLPVPVEVDEYMFFKRREERGL